MYFLFCVDLSLHVGAGNFFGILNYATKQGVSQHGIILIAAHDSV
jgi:hypothetical protein